MLCELIVSAVKAKDLGALMYPEVNVAKDDVEDARTTKKTSKNKKVAKSTKPQAVRQEGTLYRVINTFFLQEVRPFTTKIGSQPTASALDKRDFLHSDIFDKLVKIYNDPLRVILDKLYHPHEFFVNTKVANEDVASKFDFLSALEFSQIFWFINYHYKVALRQSTRSGTHDPFQNHVRTQPYIFAYYLCLLEAPVELENLANPKCPKGVFRESTATLNKEKEDSDVSPKKKKPRKTTARRKNPSAVISSSVQEMSNVSVVVSSFRHDTPVHFMFHFFSNLKAAKERTELYRERNGDLHKQGVDKHALDVKKHALDVKRHALAEVDRLSQQLNNQQNSLFTAYKTLAGLKARTVMTLTPWKHKMQNR